MTEKQRISKLRRQAAKQTAMYDLSREALKVGLVITPVCDACISDGFLVTTTKEEAKAIRYQEVALF